ncbi:MAG: ferritin family protein [Nitrospirota bacterium]|nr:ferritin family protein [Nitrospirota bacterium]
MMAREKEMFKKFKFAIEKEYEAYELYKGIAEESSDKKMKMMFEEIASDELEHRRKIMAMYKKMKEESL